MHRPQISLLSAAALALALQNASAVSLDDFTPRVSNLPSACENLYTSEIDGCDSSDFSAGACSATCVAALETLSASIKVSCASDASGDNIINAMIHDKGILRICPSAGSSGSASATVTASTKQSSTTTSANPLETESIGDGTMVLSAAPVTTGSLLVDTSTSTATTSGSGSKTAGSVQKASITKTSSSVSSSSSDSILHADTSAPASADTTSYSYAATATKSSSEAEATTGGGGSPFDGGDDSSDSVRVSSSILTILPAALLGLVLVR